MLLIKQAEQESLRSSSSEEEEMLTWQDYKAMPFTQCVSNHFCYKLRNYAMFC